MSERWPHFGDHMKTEMVGLLVRCLRDQDPQVRRSAAYALAAVGDRRAVEPLVSLLGDPEDGVKLEAVAALGRLRPHAHTVDALLACSKDCSEHVQVEVMRWLGRIGGPQAVDALLACSKDCTELVQIEIVRSLGSIGGPQAVDALLALLSQPPLTLEVCNALGSACAEQAVQPLVALLRKSRQPSSTWRSLTPITKPAPTLSLLARSESDERIAAAAALSKLGSAAVMSLVAAISDDDRDVRSKAAEALAEIFDSRGCRALIEAALEADEMSWPACCALRAQGVDSVLDLLTIGAKDGDPATAARACELLGWAHAQETIGLLLESLNHPVGAVRVAAAGALGRLRNSLTIEPLVKALADADDAVAIAAAKAIKQIGAVGIDAARLVTIALRFRPDRIPYPIEAAPTRQDLILDIVSQIGPSAADVLLQAFNDGHFWDCDQAVEALGNTAGPRALDVLLTCLGSDRYDVRIAAAMALGKIPTAPVVNALVDALPNRDKWETQSEVAKALKNIGGPAVVTAVVPLLQDEHLGDVAIEILGSIGNGAVDHLLRHFGETTNWYTRCRVLFALRHSLDSRAVELATVMIETSKDQRQREEAFFYLQELGVTAKDSLLGFLRHPEFGGSASLTLGEIGEPVLQDLVQAAKSGNPLVRKNALRALGLGRLHHPTAYRVAIDGLRDATPEVREAAAFALARLSHGVEEGSRPYEVK